MPNPHVPPWGLQLVRVPRWVRGWSRETSTLGGWSGARPTGSGLSHHLLGELSESWNLSGPLLPHLLHEVLSSHEVMEGK